MSNARIQAEDLLATALFFDIICRGSHFTFALSTDRLFSPIIAQEPRLHPVAATLSINDHRRRSRTLPRSANQTGRHRRRGRRFTHQYMVYHRPANSERQCEYLHANCFSAKMIMTRTCSAGCHNLVYSSSVLVHDEYQTLTHTRLRRASM